MKPSWKRPLKIRLERSVNALQVAIIVLAGIVAVLASALVWQNADRLRQLVVSPPPAGGYLNFTSVHDGDTFRIGEERIRIIGMDAPEIGSGAQCPNEQQMAEASRDYLRHALSGNNVSVNRHGVDVYGRTLAYVYVDGRDIADTMIAAGLAKDYVRGTHGDWCSN